MDHPIERYIVNLSRYLPVADVECAAIVEEVRTHIEEKAMGYVESGMDRVAAEQEALKAFGKPQVLAKQLSSIHPTHWGIRRFLKAALIGWLISWCLWTATAFPLLVDNAIKQFQPGNDILSSPLRLLFLSTPISEVGVSFLLHPWLLPILLLYLAMPFLWGTSTHRWWVPGLAYGLGTVTTQPGSYVFLRNIADPSSAFPTLSILLLATLPLAVLAAGLGYAWHQLYNSVINKHHFLMLSRLRRRFSEQSQSVTDEQPSLLQSRGLAYASLTQRGISRKGILGVIIGIIIIALQVFSFVRVWSVAQQSLLTPAQQLTTIQKSFTFQIKQPQWLPAGASLDQVFSSACNSCTEKSENVTLSYRFKDSTDAITINESNASFAPPEGSYDDGSGHQKPFAVSSSMVVLGSLNAMVNISTGVLKDGTEIQQVDILWSQENTYYLLSSFGSRTSLEDLEHIVMSI
jgi:hypothetical protein